MWHEPPLERNVVFLTSTGNSSHWSLGFLFSTLDGIIELLGWLVFFFIVYHAKILKPQPEPFPNGITHWNCSEFIFVTESWKFDTSFRVPKLMEETLPRSGKGMLRSGTGEIVWLPLT